MSKLLSYFISDDKKEFQVLCNKQTSVKHSKYDNQKKSSKNTTKQLKLTQFFQSKDLSKQSENNSSTSRNQQFQLDSKQFSGISFQIQNPFIKGKEQKASIVGAKQIVEKTQKESLYKLATAQHHIQLNKMISFQSDSPIKSQSSMTDTQVPDDSFSSMSLSEIFQTSESLNKDTHANINKKRRAPTCHEVPILKKIQISSNSPQTPKKNQSSLLCPQADIFTCSEQLSDDENEIIDVENQNSFSKEIMEPQEDQFEDEIDLMIHLQRMNNTNKSLKLTSSENQHPFFNGQTRITVLNWMTELCSYFQMARYTCQISIDMLDRYLSTNPSNVSRANIQLIAGTCVFICAKSEEQTCPLLKDFVKTTKGVFSENDFCKQELHILKVLDYKINSDTLEQWIRSVCKCWELKSNVKISEDAQIIKDYSYFQNLSTSQFNLQDQQTQEDISSSEIQQFSYIQEIVDLLYLNPKTYSFEREIIAYAFVYILNGLQTKEFLLQDIVTHFSKISEIFDQEFFDSYNQQMINFFQTLSSSLHTSLSIPALIQTIEYVSELFEYFQYKQPSSNKPIWRQRIQREQSEFISQVITPQE